MPKSEQTQPVTFIDNIYKQRKISVGDDQLLVINHRITVSDPVHIEALATDPTLTRQE